MLVSDSSLNTTSIQQETDLRLVGDGSEPLV